MEALAAKTGHGEAGEHKSWCLLGCWGGGGSKLTPRFLMQRRHRGRSKCEMSCEEHEKLLLSVAFCSLSFRLDKRGNRSSMLPFFLQPPRSFTASGGEGAAGRAKAGVLANTGLTPPVLVRREPEPPAEHLPCVGCPAPPRPGAWPLTLGAVSRLNEMAKKNKGWGPTGRFRRLEDFLQRRFFQLQL